MAEILLQPRTVLPAVLVVLLLVLLAVRRRRSALASREQRRLVDTVLATTRRPHGRHLAVQSPPSGVTLLMLVPIAAKRRRRPLDVGPQFMSIQTDADDDIGVDDIVVAEAPVHSEFGSAALEALRSAEDGIEDHDTYRRRVDATIQAMSRRIEPGEAPELVEARMLAAMDRLDAPVEFARPPLSPAVLPRPNLTPELPAPEPPAPEPPAPEPPAPEQPVPDAAPVPIVRPEDTRVEDVEVVLPVPPLPPSADPRRRGLRRRGKAG